MRTRRQKVTTDSHGQSDSAVNLLDGDFLADEPNWKWAGDISYIWTVEGWLYPAAIINQFSRGVIGEAASEQMKKDMANPSPSSSISMASTIHGDAIHIWAVSAISLLKQE